MTGAQSNGVSLLTIDAGFPFTSTFVCFDQQQKITHLRHISLLWKTRKMSKQKKVLALIFLRNASMVVR